jgi:hypothetical protein
MKEKVPHKEDLSYVLAFLCIHPIIGIITALVNHDAGRRRRAFQAIVMSAIPFIWWLLLDY